MNSTRLHIHPLAASVLLFSFVISPLKASGDPRIVQSDTASLNHLLRVSIRAAADSIDQVVKSGIGLFQKRSARTADSASGVLRASAERLIKEAAESLNPQRRDTVRNLAQILAKAIGNCAAEARKSGDESFRNYHKWMFALERKYSSCSDCGNSQDVQSTVEEFLDASDSLGDLVHQSWEDLTESIRDSLDDYVDRLGDASSDMIDRQSDEDELIAAHASRLVLSGSYTSDVTYRGRDGGVRQYALSPEVEYKAHSGLFVAASAAWLGNSPNAWDERTVGGGYEFELGTHFTGSFSYTRFWFNDSSRLEKADMKNSIDGELEVLTKPINVSVSPSFAFSTASEFTTEFSLSHEFDIDTFLRRADLSIEPTVTAIVGGQNALLTQQRLKRAVNKKGKAVTVVKTTTKIKNFFGILDYEFAVPFELTYKNAAINPQFSYAIPLNVVDASSAAPFFYFSVNVSYTIR